MESSFNFYPPGFSVSLGMKGTSSFDNIILRSAGGGLLRFSFKYRNEFIVIHTSLKRLRYEF